MVKRMLTGGVLMIVVGDELEQAATSAINEQSVNKRMGRMQFT
jgi:hypothetical protein